MKFAPIAIVGQGCALPGALSPQALWRQVIDKQVSLSDAQAEAWRVEPEAVLKREPSSDHTWSWRGGYVRGFDEVFDASGLAWPAEKVKQQDQLLQWLIHSTKQALEGVTVDASAARVGAIIGNLSYPTAQMSDYAERVWQGQEVSHDQAMARFMSGLPAHNLLSAFGFEGQAFALDAACASSLYALKMACDALHDGRADVMIAGGVNHADDLFIHIGFCALQAMSKTGQSRPFHQGADGLVPAEGAGVLVLKRLADAIAAGDPILGLVRGIGLSNDGRGRGMLSPSELGQERAMRQAYAESGLSPDDISFIECHATGTPLGDATELRSMARVFEGRQGLPVSSLKANTGHLITASGAAGIIKILAAMKHKTLPGNLYTEEALELLAEGPFTLMPEAAPWQPTSPDGIRRAVINNFGFGGNNAHVIIEEWTGQQHPSFELPPAPLPQEDVVIVALGARVGEVTGAEALAEALLSGAGALGADGRAKAEQISFDLKKLRFPPNDLKQTLPQQLMLLETGFQLEAQLAKLDPERTSMLIGMSCDAEITRYGARWRLINHLDSEQLEQAREAIVPGLKSAGVLGTMPNIVANRLNSQFDLMGPSFSLSSEELSGVVALEHAVRALRHRELDAAVVGAVDMSCEPLHERAAREVLSPALNHSADAAVLMVLKRRSDAQRDNDPILAIIPGARPEQGGLELELGPQDAGLTPMLGHAHATSGLLHVAAIALCLSQRQLPGGQGWPADEQDQRAVRLTVSSFSGQAQHLWMTQGPAPVALKSLGAASAQADGAAMMRFAGHWPPVQYPQLNLKNVTPAEPLVSSKPTSKATGQQQVMAPAPRLPSVYSPVVASAPAPTPQPVQAPPSSVITAAAQPSLPSMPALEPQPAPVWLMAPGEQDFTPEDPALFKAMSYFEAFAALHEQYLEQQATLQQRFLQTRTLLAQQLLSSQGELEDATWSAPAPVAQPEVNTSLEASLAAVERSHVPTPVQPMAEVVAPVSAPVVKPAPVKAPQPQPKAAPVVAKPAPAKKDTVAQAPPQASVDQRDAFKPTKKRQPVGPTFDRAQLEIHASGNISEIFGEQFKAQDQYAVQVRMPEPPLLLCDRVTGIDAEPNKLSTGTMWTETDVREDSWYLHEGRMPTGIMIESGQADLMLISWMGADMLNQGERAYRLLGCDLRFHGPLPRPGDTLSYDIHVDGHAKQDAIRLFFFHYDCCIDGQVRLSVRQGQAGFFTTEELAESKGILWSPFDETVEGGRLDAPKVKHIAKRYDRAQIEAFAARKPWEAFGDEFFMTKTHTLTPSIQQGDMLFLDEIEELDVQGGPWGRGYMRAVQHISPETWFFDGHFKNDPCMPGTLMFEGCVQTMAFYLSALGFTIDKDGWVFEPVPHETYKLRCRGQVVPTSKRLVYEIFVKEVHSGPEPTLFADLLCTIDGLKAFHCGRMGLKLTPSWPLERDKSLLESYVEPKPVASVNGFKFDYASLLACAWGRPSSAFGPVYEVFDGARQVARLPGPPYHFISRVTHVDEPMVAMKPGLELDVEYDVPPDAWYFTENGSQVMPLAVLMETALQPCGWLASYTGCALTKDIDLYFRNLDGTGTQHAEVTPQTGTLRTHVKLLSITQAAGMILVKFDVEMRAMDPAQTLIYTMNTSFGFFPKEALAQQAGIDASPELKGWVLNEASDYLVDLTQRPARFCADGAKLAQPMLLMVDRLTGYWPEGGERGLGRIRGEKDVDPGEWFFKAHFYQDPVQPGSLGIEALLQLLQSMMVQKGLDEGFKAPRFEAIALDKALSWKYRGQVLPWNKTITSSLELVEVGRDDQGVYAIADASLWVDGMRIYSATNLAMRIVEGEATGPFDQARWRTTPTEVELTLDVASAPWLLDHCPTYTAPALPMTCILDELARAASAHYPGQTVTGLRDVKLQRWVIVEGEERLRTRVEPIDAHHAKVTLERWWSAPIAAMSRFDVVAAGVVIFDLAEQVPALPAPLVNPVAQPDPYTSAALFHGPQMQVVTQWLMDGQGADGVLSCGHSEVPVGLLAPLVLDGALQVIPHDHLHLWAPQLEDDFIGYPHGVERFQVFGPLPELDQPILTQARFVGLDDQARFASFDVTVSQGGRVWAQLRLVEVLFPKGRLGRAPALERRAFLFDHQFCAGVGLSALDLEAGTASLEQSDVKLSDWFKGTIATTYQVSGTLAEQTEAIALKDAGAQSLQVHPSAVEIDAARGVLYSAKTPWHTCRYEVLERRPAGLTVKAGAAELNLEPLSQFWQQRLGMAPGWIGDDVYTSFVSHYVSGVELEDPQDFASLQGRSVLFLGNHQVQIESLLITAIASCLTQTQVVTMANAKHERGWVGQLVRQIFSYPGCQDPRNIVYFEQSKPESMMSLIEGFKADVASRGVSVMVHAPGTRAQSSHEVVEKVSSMFIDMVLELNMPIVPVSFAGGLPSEPIEGKLEFPYEHGAQRYILGRAIRPEQLKQLPYAQRRGLILSCINGLGRPYLDFTAPANASLAARVAQLEAEGLEHINATLLANLEALPKPGAATRALLAAHHGEPVDVEPELAAWVEAFAPRFKR